MLGELVCDYAYDTNYAKVKNNYNVYISILKHLDHTLTPDMDGWAYIPLDKKSKNGIDLSVFYAFDKAHTFLWLSDYERYLSSFTDKKTALFNVVESLRL